MSASKSNLKQDNEQEALHWLLQYGPQVVLHSPRLRPSIREDVGESWLAENATQVTFRVHNRLLPAQSIPDCVIELTMGMHTIRGRTAANGRLVLDLTGLPNGDYDFRATPADVSTDPVGPLIASATPRPDRIWRGLQSTVTVHNTRITTVGHSQVTLNGNSVAVLLQPVWMRSPNRRARPAGVALDRIVVHHTAGPVIGPALNTFLSTSEGTSAHYVIDTDGQIVKMVDESEQAIHAGCSEWEGRASVNGFSIGIEIVHRDGAYPPAQMTAVIDLIQRIRAAHPAIPAHGIIGHSDIALSIPGNAHCPGSVKRLGRKLNDPGVNFNWSQLAAAGVGRPVPTADQLATSASLRRLNLPLAGFAFLLPIYGGFFNTVPGGRLRPGDRDNTHQFGGAARPALATPIIAELQTDLAAIGYFCPVDGEYGSQTDYAVRAFQQHFMESAGTPVSRRGEVDENTAEAIKAVRP
jgi:N-acetyl-anhydromuramyl-L-alanine amidase AmpD